MALTKNTVVSSIVVDLFLLRTESYWSEEPREINKIQRNNTAPLLKFLETGSALTEVTLRDDLGDKRLFSESKSVEWASLFCESIAKNPNLSVLCLETSIRLSPNAFVNLLQTAMSLTSLEFGLSIFGSRVDEALPTAVAQAIAAHPSLKTLRLRIAQPTAAATTVTLLTRLGDLRAALQELDISLHHDAGDPTAADSAETVTALMQALKSILHSTTALNQLTLGSFHFDQASINHLLAGLSANRTMTKLAFVDGCRWEKQATRAFVDYL
jgi:hypothetical protein